MSTLGDIKDLAILGGLGVGAYLIYKFLNTPAGEVSKAVEKGVYDFDVETREYLTKPPSLENFVFPTFSGFYGGIGQFLSSLVPSVETRYDFGGYSGGQALE